MVFLASDASSYVTGQVLRSTAGGRPSDAAAASSIRKTAAGTDAAPAMAVLAGMTETEGGAVARVLVVDDDPTVREVVVSYLKAAQHEVVEAEDGESVATIVRDSPVDLVVLDLMLPGIDGLEVCRRLRATSDVPVIMLTALGLRDRPGRRAGAGRRRLRDQAVQPARAGAAGGVGAAPRGRAHGDPTRAGWRTATSWSTSRRHEASLAGRVLALTAREYDLLRFLLAHPGIAFSREDLLQQVWGWSFGDHSTVTVHVRRLREKVERDPTMPERLVTVWGVGYRWEPAPGST